VGLTAVRDVLRPVGPVEQVNDVLVGVVWLNPQRARLVPASDRSVLSQRGGGVCTTVVFAAVERGAGTSGV
jgi:hypothetical protein